MEKLIIAVVALGVWKVSSTFLSKFIEDISTKKIVTPYRKKYLMKTMHISLAFFLGIVTIGLMGVEYSQISIFLSSVIALFGVAFIAQWSILSNITASIIIFFNFPYRVGDHIKVVDKDSEIAGIVEEISLFHVLIRKDDEIITYPNNLILQKAVIKKDLPITEEKPRPPKKDYPY